MADVAIENEGPLNPIPSQKFSIDVHSYTKLLQYAYLTPILVIFLRLTPIFFQKLVAFCLY